MRKCGEIKRYRRFEGWDYAKGASLFITIGTDPQRPLFGEVREGAVVLTPLGEAVREALQAIPRLNPGISLFGHVVMPDHVHFNCHLAAGLDKPLKVLGNAIRRFKNYTTKSAKRSLAITAEADSRGEAVEYVRTLSEDGRTVFGQLWQQGYHDHLCLSRGFIDSTERYIAYNPLKWELMHGTGDGLRIVEPLSSPRFDVGDYWKGVGNVALLDPKEKLLALRVSRKVTSAETERMLEYVINAVSQGYIIVSGFISKGEQAVRDMLCERRDGRFIRILPSSIPNGRFRPESRYVTPFAEGRYLEIAEGNEEVTFGRRACLDLNAEIIKITEAGEGKAVYWREEGLVERSSTISTEAKGGVFAERSLTISNDADGLSEASEFGRTVSEDGRTAFGQTLFITGCTGFFGKSLLDYRLRHPEWRWAKAKWVILSRAPVRFKAEYPRLALQDGVSFWEGDVRSFPFPEGEFDAIIHAATSAVTTLSDDEMTSVICAGTRHVVDFAKAVGCKKIILTSSGAVYGPRVASASEDDECLPVTAYGKGKLQAERMLLDSGLDVKIARCFAFVGPYLPRTIHYAIGNFIQNCLDGRPIVINGDGTPLRSYMYADDLVEWLFAILERGESGRAYNVGSDRAVSILELAEIVREVLGSESEIVVKGTPIAGAVPSAYVPSIARAREELGLDVKVSLEKAIRLSV